MFERAKLGRYIRLTLLKVGFFGNFIFIISKKDPLSILLFFTFYFRKIRLKPYFNKQLYVFLLKN